MICPKCGYNSNYVFLPVGDNRALQIDIKKGVMRMLTSESGRWNTGPWKSYDPDKIKPHCGFVVDSFGSEYLECERPARKYRAADGGMLFLCAEHYEALREERKLKSV